MKLLSKRYRWSRCVWLAIAIAIGCVEPIEFEVPPAEEQLVVEGMITDLIGPYTVKVSRAFGLNRFDTSSGPVTDLTIVLFDGVGNVEPFLELSPGIYQTEELICGQVGNAYHIEISMPSGDKIISKSDTLKAGGAIEKIDFEYQSRTVLELNAEVPADVFNVYIDATIPENEQQSFVRWKFTGTYKVLTFPELREIVTPRYPTPYKAPYPCSGYIVVEFIPGGKLEQITPCACCECWVTNYEKMPNLSDNQLIQGGYFRGIKVGEVPINNRTLYDKYLVTVEQFSMTKTSFDYFRLVRNQKEQANSIFQPPSADIIGNLVVEQGNIRVIGLFWATSVTNAKVFVEPSKVPYNVTPIAIETFPCYDICDNSTTVRPIEWVD
jgi:hypothetical protein